MRISKISVTKLFGIFDHPVSLNLEERITIIHGPNGFGKTALLRLINGFLNSQYSEIISIPFSRIRLDFDNGSYLLITKHIGKNSHQEQYTKLTFEFFNLDSNSETFSLILSVDSKGNIRLHNSKNDQTNQQLDIFLAIKLLEEVREPSDRLRDKDLEIAKQEPTWLSEIKSSIHVRFIESQRLLHLSELPKRRVDWERPSMIFSVDTYSKELARNIQAKLAEYAALSQSLDRTFPARVVNNQAPSDLTEEALRNKLNKIEEQRSRLIKTGLLDKDENPDFQVQQTINETTKNILYVYLEDVEKKNSLFNELATKIELFQRIITQRFRYKTIRSDKKKGFIFTTSNAKPLSPTDLSSGEQHELVMLYELLFKVKPNSLILIDEPEISLHLAWQVQFLKDLQAIIKLADFDVLIATHSPSIIEDRWDLTVELKGPVE
jgi:predicted ATP-binding protein involved in virulence